jgi:transposase
VHQLESLASRPKAAQRSVYRAKIILSRLAGVGVRAIAKALNCKHATVRKWCRRVAAKGLHGHNDTQRSGPPRRISAVERCSVVAAACQASLRSCAVPRVAEAD